MRVEASDLVVLVDTGSAWTKALIVARHGRRWRIAAAAAQPTSWGEELLISGLAARVARHADPRLSHGLVERLRAAPRIETHTPRRPGRLALAAVSQHVSAPVLRRAAESAGWVMVEEATADDGRPLADRLAALSAAEVDAWLLGGGFEGSASPQALEMAALAAAARGGAGQPVIWAGASDLDGEVRRLFTPPVTGASTSGALSVVPNPLPAEGVERPAALRTQLETLLERIVEPRGSHHLAPVSYRRAITELARSADLRILGVDIGAGYATWVVADSEGEVDARVFAEGGLVADALTEPGSAARIARDLAGPIDELIVADALQNLRARPATVPQTDAELSIVHAAARHQLARVVAGEPAAEGVDLIIGSGRTIAGAPRLADAARVLVDGLRPVGVTQLALDVAGGLGPLGSLDDGEIGEGIALLRDDLVVPLGTAIVCRGGRPGQVAMRVTLAVDDGEPGGSVEVRSGQLTILPLPRGRMAEVGVELIGGATLGAEGRGRRARLRVTGGAVGLILDARDVPLRLPRRPDDRRTVLSAWRDVWHREPQRLPADGDAETTPGAAQEREG